MSEASSRTSQIYKGNLFFPNERGFFGKSGFARGDNVFTLHTDCKSYEMVFDQLLGYFEVHLTGF